jgi:hypothetical protein
MPQFAVVDGDEVDELVADGGINKKTSEARARIVGYVEKFLESKETPSNLDALVDLAATGDSAPLEAALMDFFAAYRVSGPDSCPSGGQLTTSEATSRSLSSMHPTERSTSRTDRSSRGWRGSSPGILNSSRWPDVGRSSTLQVLPWKCKRIKFTLVMHSFPNVPNGFSNFSRFCPF